MSNTNIEWTDKTWNPIRGCSRVSSGCVNCYAEKMAARIGRMDRGRGIAEGDGAYDGLLAKGGQWNGQIKTVSENLELPLRWRKPQKIFVNSMSDLFHENTPTEYIDHIFAVMALASDHIFQILTKRPERMRTYLSDPDLGRRIGIAERKFASMAPFYRQKNGCANVHLGVKRVMPLPNVWLGVSVEDQQTADERIPVLLDTPAAIRWLSMEPLLGPVNLWPAYWPCPNAANGLRMDPETGSYDCCRQCDYTGVGSEMGIDWIVVGGESGPDARPMHPEWARSIRDDCKIANVPFFFKQWGKPQHGQSGNLLDGVLHQAFPEGVSR